MKRTLSKSPPLNRTGKTSAGLLAAACIAVATAACVAPSGAHEWATSPGTGLRCAVVTRTLGGSVEISGRVSAKHGVQGTYKMSIRQSGRAGQAMIDQAGDFSVAAGRTTTLGQAVLGGPASNYRADLVLDVNGTRLRCLGVDGLTDI